MVLRKNKKDNKIYFVDVSKEFVCFDIKNKLFDVNINKILDIIWYKIDNDYFLRYVDVSEVIEKEYNLVVNIYIEIENIDEIVDIIKLNLKIFEIVKKVDILRKLIDFIVIDLEGDNKWVKLMNF